tara:strand:- start:1862 stop:1987 length:126 start_codon:yes stop_codon:yes gene_type:complete
MAWVIVGVRRMAVGKVVGKNEMSHMQDIKTSFPDENQFMIK